MPVATTARERRIFILCKPPKLSEAKKRAALFIIRDRRVRVHLIDQSIFKQAPEHIVRSFIETQRLDAAVSNKVVHALADSNPIFSGDHSVTSVTQYRTHSAKNHAIARRSAACYSPDKRNPQCLFAIR